MTGRVVRWQEDTEPIGEAVVAIGVFDGVHLGHQKLLASAVEQASQSGAKSVAVTFDRDPDQIVMPEAAAPQLLSLEDKCRFILATGIDYVVVIPFTEEISRLTPREFLDRVLTSCCKVVAIHVGADFHFGAKASGDVTTLQEWAAQAAASVMPHSLLVVGEEPVTSTRIRRLVASGDVAGAAALLGRPTRLQGGVHKGREQGRELGFPTANVVPDPFSAVPGDGVYAGRVVLEEGETWPAAISVGVPPTFPEARDYVEAHAIGFSGDLYGRKITLEFVEKLRDQRAFGSLPELVEAITADVRRASFAVAGEPPFELNPAIDIGHKVVHTMGMDVEVAEEGDPTVEDPIALAAAERAVASRSASAPVNAGNEEWVELLSPTRLSGIFGNAGFTGALVTAPLQAADIPFLWDPYPPEQMPSFRPYYGIFDRPFALLVPENRLEEAREIFSAAYGAGSVERPSTAIRRTAPVREVDMRASHRFVRAVVWGVIILALIAFLATVRL